MRRKYPRSFALILSLAVICIGRANPTSIESHQDQTVKIGVTLVQVDAVVTDDHGNPVRDLKPEDFEVFEDGHKQRISNFSFINTLSSPAQPHPAAVKPPDKSALYIPPPNLLPEQVKRTIALVVDDLSMSPSSIIETKQALKKFVSDRMEPGDLVAVIRTGGGMGALQQFTSDKRRLYAAIDRIWWNPFGNGGISAVPAIGGAPIRAADINVPPDNLSSGFSGDDRQIAEESRRQIFAAGTLGAVNYVVKGLAELPGRKSVVLMSEGFPVNYERGRDTRIFDLLRQLADLANRASVVVYTIDPRGLVDLGLTAADDVGRMTPQEVERSLDARSDAFRQSQEALLYLAAETGGLAVRNSNDIVRGLDRVMNDQNGYYLIGFIPDEKTFKTVNGARPFHDVKVSVKRAGLHVRYHHGFYGISDQEIHAVPQTRAQQMAAALISPFSSGGISVKL
ncbi:MAG: VWA domain-containing protein, partial [Blastocatellia bacterium]